MYIKFHQKKFISLQYFKQWVIFRRYDVEVISGRSNRDIQRFITVSSVCFDSCNVKISTLKIGGLKFLASKFTANR